MNYVRILLGSDVVLGWAHRCFLGTCVGVNLMPWRCMTHLPRENSSCTLLHSIAVTAQAAKAQC